jgi:F420 biosynthesis protein FbiB-like protein
MTLPNIIRSRRAIRRYQDKPVPVTLITELLETAVWSPSAHNRQPWRFAILTKAATKTKLAQAMGQRLQADRAADGDPPDVIARDVARSYQRITGAPVVVVVCLSMQDMDHYPDERRQTNERIMAVQSVAMAAQNLWLLAHNAGLGACWLCAPLFVPQLVQTTLGLSADWEPQGLMTFGWPAEEKEKTRRPLKDVVCFVDE